MRASPAIENMKVQEIASLLIPMRGYQLLLPNVSVAEIVPVSQVAPVEDAPLWYLGTCSWREQHVPLLSFEALNGEPKAEAHARTRFAVLNATGTSDDLPFIAIICQGLPRLARVNEEEITPHDHEEPKTYQLMQVSWAGEEAIIPDLARIERAVLEYLRT
jgi:chemosensory pili system protein ChpC